MSVGLVVLMLCPPAEAATLNVGPTQTYQTIQGAINASSPGDVIQIADGIYAERLVFKWQTGR